MKKLTLYYATNRNHLDNQWQPTGYGTEFSQSEGAGAQNLRFGKLTLEADADTINQHLKAQADGGVGNGAKLSEYLTSVANKSKITAYKEQSDENKIKKFGSLAMFDELKQAMLKSNDVLIYVHGFNVSWCDAVGSALALQEMVNQKTADKQENILVILFSWPSNGRAIPYLSYYNDRFDACNIASANTFSRGMLILRKYLSKIDRKDQCQRKIHLLCHSMGNYVLQHSLKAMVSQKTVLPVVFDTIFMCAPDVDHNVFEYEMKRLPEITRRISIYYNEEDKAMWLSDNTKFNPDRLGDEGVNTFDGLSRKIHQIDCTEVVTETTAEHSYYLNGLINKDIRLSLFGFPANSNKRNRQGQKQTNAWQLVQEN